MLKILLQTLVDKYELELKRLYLLYTEGSSSLSEINFNYGRYCKLIEVVEDLTKILNCEDK